jgi:hypothetical protein
MIINVLLLIDNKLTSSKIKLTKTSNSIIINYIEPTGLHQNGIIKIPIYNNINGMNYEPILFPFHMTIVNNLVISYYIILSSYVIEATNEIDFFYQINRAISKEYNLSLARFNYLLENDTIPLLNSMCGNGISEISMTDTNQFIKNLWDSINSIKLYIIYISIRFPHSTKKKLHSKYNIPKRIISLYEMFCDYKYNLNNIDDEIMLPFSEYYMKDNNRILNKDEIISKYSYYIDVRDVSTTETAISTIAINKIFKIFVNNKMDNIIEIPNKTILFNNYNWYYFYPYIKINKDYVLFQTFININITKHIIEKLLNGTIYSSKLIDYYYVDNKYSNLLFLDTMNDIDILKTKSYSNDYFKYIVKKYTEESKVFEILEILFNQYNYPLKPNRMELDNIFDYILYISIINNKLIIEKSKHNYNDVLHSSINNIIPIKVKNLYINILKTLCQVINGEYESIKYNQKFYTDYLHKSILKMIISDSSNISIVLFKSLTSTMNYEKFKMVATINFSLLDVGNRLNWNNISKKINYLNLYYKNQDIVFYQDKLNKNIFIENFDNRIKKIIENPFDMFKYLRKEKDFIRWAKFISHRLVSIYIVPISLSSDDFALIGTMLFLLYNIKEQNLKDPTYIEFIKFCSNNNKLILDSNRINIKIKEQFINLKCIINLGFLAKHLTWNVEEITFDDKPNDVEHNITALKTKLDLTTKKYYKYKIKYLKTKKPNINVNLSETSLKTPSLGQ